MGAQREANVFEGSSAVRDLLDPGKYGPLPLVEIPSELNAYRADGVRIFAKLMYLFPLLNIKALPSLQMLLDAEAEGRLAGIHTMVEASSGNTAFSLAVIARLFGIRVVKAIVPRDIAPGKLELLRLSGADPVFSGDGGGDVGGIAQARQLGLLPGYFNAGQYENESNPAAHERWTAQQVWEQLGGRLSVYCCGLGTSGTAVGARRFFGRVGSTAALVGVACAAGTAVPGVRSVQRLGEVGFDWRGVLDELVEVRTTESFRRSLQLCRAGLMAGPSSGFALAGLLQFIRERADSGRLDALRNQEGEVVAAFICPDTPLPYLDKYSTHLAPEDFL